MGFYGPAQLVRDAEEHGVEIRGVDVNMSGWDCALDKAAFDPTRIVARHVEMRPAIRTMHAIRLGFNQVKGLSDKRMEGFVLRRGAGYESVRDVWLRSGLDVDEIEKLAQADAFRSLGLDRRAALWAVRALDGKSAAERLPLFDQPTIRLRDNEPETRLPKMPLGEHVIHDYRSLGLSLKAHPVSFLRQRLDRAGVTPNGRLPAIKDGRRVSVAGLVLVRQRPGKGNAIFLTLEDEKAIANIIVWPRVFDRFRPVIMGSKFVRVTGKLQSESGVLHIVADRIDDLSPWLATLLEETATRNAEVHGVEYGTNMWMGREQARSRLGPLVRKNAPVTRDIETLTHEAGGVMPKGRNFQ
jgi:error-prone DNA polymerase